LGPSEILARSILRPWRMALVLSCSDMFFGHHHNLIMPGKPRI
jgi:allantoicase